MLRLGGEIETRRAVNNDIREGRKEKEMENKNRGKSMRFTIRVATAKIAIIAITAILISNLYWNHTSTVQAAQQQQAYNQMLAEAETDLVQNIEVAGIATDSVALQIGDEVHVYNYSFIENTEGEENFGSTKTYENYHLINSTTARQTKLVRCADAYTDQNGYRKVLDYYCVALGSFYGTIGDIFQVTLDTGRVILVIKADEKSDAHTDETHRYHVSDKSVLEFIVDYTEENPFKRNPTKDFPGGISDIKLIGRYDF